MNTYANIRPGDPAPLFHQRAFGNSRLAFDSIAGHYVVLCLFGTASNPRSQRAIAAVLSRKDLFDDVKTTFFGVSIDPTDETDRRVADLYPGYHFFWDFDATVSCLYGAVPKDIKPGSTTVPIRQIW